MLDLDKLEAEMEKAKIDKADLFDFYHEHWDAIVAALRGFQDEKRRQEVIAANILEHHTEYLKKAYAGE